MPVTIQITSPITVEEIELGHRVLDAAKPLDSSGTDDELRLQIRHAAKRSQGALLLRKVAEFVVEHGRGPTGPEVQATIRRPVGGMMMSLNAYAKNSGAESLLRNEYHAVSPTPRYVMEPHVAELVLEVIDAGGNLT